MARKTRPTGALDSIPKQIQELEYLVMRICESLKIETRYT